MTTTASLIIDLYQYAHIYPSCPTMCEDSGKTLSPPFRPVCEKHVFPHHIFPIIHANNATMNNGCPSKIQLFIEINFIKLSSFHNFLSLSSLLSLDRKMDFVLSLDNLEWLRAHLPVSEDDKAKASLSLLPLENAGGLTGTMKIVMVDIPDNADFQKRRFVLKTVDEASKARLQSLGCPREALFYQQLAPRLRAEGTAIPLTIFAHGDMQTGDKVIVMEDLTYHGLQSGLFYGPYTPLNWGKDLSVVDKIPTPVTVKDVARDSFLQAARLHRCYWKDESLLQHSWLRATNWMQGNGKEAWDASMQTVKTSWATAKAKIENGTCKVNWDANLLATVDASIAKLDFDKYVAIFQQRAWTLVHGDYHPANMIWAWDVETKEAKSMLLDWEMVGVGSGPQELSQCLISHMKPSLRKELERELVQDYYDTLVADEKVQNYSFEDCWEDYKSGGTERWIWLLTYLAALCPDPMVQYFQDQVAAFINDHGVNPENVGMPRA